MKIKNSTPWCNLYSTGSKYNFSIKESRYRHYLFFCSVVLLNLLLIIYTTYAYQFVLTIVVLMMTAMSVLIVKRNAKQLTAFYMNIDENGVCSFESMFENSVVSSSDVSEQFQILASSRYSFFGCWLDMYSTKLLNNAINKKHIKKQLFIYRDSLSSEDFSRLSQIIRKLKVSI